MSDPLLVIGAITALAIFYVMLPVFLNARSYYRKQKEVNCPRKNEHTFVTIDADRAALTALAGASKLRIRSCPFWCDEMFCNQECLRQLS